MTPRNVAGGFAAAALIASLAGGGGSTTLAELVVLLSCTAALAASGALAAPAPASPWTGRLAAGLAGILAVSAACASYANGSLSDLGRWLAPLALACGTARLLRAEALAHGAEAASRAAGRLVLAASAAFVAIQVAGLAGLPLGGQGTDVDPGRPLGTFTDPNHLGAAAALVALANFARAGRSSWILRAHAGLALAGLALVLASRSRVAPVALAAAAIVHAATRPQHRKLALGLAAASLAAAGALVAARAGEIDAWTRPAIWRAVAPATLERPLLGFGPGQFEHAHHPYNVPVPRGVGFYEKVPSSAHGEWLRLPIEVGAVGCAVLLALLATIAARARRSGAAAEVAALGVAVAILGSVHDVLDSLAVNTWLAVLGTIALVVPETRSALGAAAPPPLARPSLALAGSVGLAVAVAALAVRPAVADWMLDSAERRGNLAGLQEGTLLLPDHPRGWLTLAALAAPPAEAGVPVDLRRHALADVLLAEAARVAPPLPAPALERARLVARTAVRLHASRPDRLHAARLYREAARRAPKDAFVRLEASSAMLALDLPAEAADEAAAALALEPELRRAHALRVVALERAGRVGEAEAARARLRDHLARTAHLRPVRRYQSDLLAADPALLDAALGAPPGHDPAVP